MGLRIYNTLTRQKEPFEPLQPGRVGVYVCGVTPYDHAHVGHARSALVFDVIRRYLVFRGHPVTFVKNYTDVDDKIIVRAAERGETPEDLTARYIKSYEDDMAVLGVEPPDIAPRATAHIEDMIRWIERLLAAEVAYVIDGDVYFAVRRFPAYGRLSGRSLDELRAGARVEVDTRKRDPLDFALWKSAKPGEPAWPSPWGPGRPGWHIECSAMSARYLGESFDLHGGGQDLIFPHHENEIAQSEAATGQPFVRYWVHNGFVNLASEKMSKSLGNVVTLKTLLGEGPLVGEALRLHFLGTHYRSPLEYAPQRVAEAQGALWRLTLLLGRVSLNAREASPGIFLGWRHLHADRVGEAVERLNGELGQATRRAWQQFSDAMDADFNTPQALATIFELGSALERETGRAGKNAPTGTALVAADILRTLARVLGLLWSQIDPFEFSQETRQRMDPLIEAREVARGARNWTRADAIRKELEGIGIAVEDTPWGPRPRWIRPPSGR